MWKLLKSPEIKWNFTPWQQEPHFGFTALFWLLSEPLHPNLRYLEWKPLTPIYTNNFLETSHLICHVRFLKTISNLFFPLKYVAIPSSPALDTIKICDVRDAAKHYQQPTKDDNFASKGPSNKNNANFVSLTRIHCKHSANSRAENAMDCGKLVLNRLYNLDYRSQSEKFKDKKFVFLPEELANKWQELLTQIASNSTTGRSSFCKCFSGK